MIDHHAVAFFAEAVRDLVPSAGTVDRETLEARLDQCARCRFRRGQVCIPMDCGCKIAGVAVCLDGRCPLGRWAQEKPLGM